MALETSADKPAPVRQVAHALGGWIGRLGWVWVDGQVAQLTRRPGTGVVFMTVRDPDTEISLSVTCHRSVLDIIEPPVTEGARVVLHARPRFYDRRGTVSLNADEIRPVGVGELLARLEQRRRLLAAEGLFAAELKRPLPFLPARIGLITGRASAAEHDVVTNAKLRWPGVQFVVRNVATQGATAAQQVMAALANLDAAQGAARVDVIIVARGGGSVEDLLPFSDEALIRAVARLRIPLVSAIGHEPDTPLLDLVADVRASTPTDAAKKVVPDVREEQQRISGLLDRTRRVIHSRVEREEAGLASVRSRPSLASPLSGIDEREVAVAGLRARTHRCLLHRLDRASSETAGALGQIRALSPLATLQRGYAVAQRTDGSVLTSARQVTVGEHISLRLADGSLTVRTVEVRTPADAGGTEEHTEGHKEDPMSDEPARRST
ncbi:MAG TPA: exodeoxyribonuclease VII large subunit [Nocardioidaceae bacterium]|nr:exodeoxyribonuclease VII large subunit [Nocardioidaceae bacterium]